MPKLLRRLLSLEVLIGLSLVVLLPVIEATEMRIPTTLAALLPVVICFAFLLRIPISYLAMATYSAIVTCSGILFVALKILLPNSHAFEATNFFLMLESVVCGLLFWQLQKPATKTWFEQTSEVNS